MLVIGHNLKQGHTGPIIVNHNFFAYVYRLRSVLFHLNALYRYMILLLIMIVVHEAAVEHDWVVLLGDLVSLR